MGVSCELSGINVLASQLSGSMVKQAPAKSLFWRANPPISPYGLPVMAYVIDFNPDYCYSKT
jgi:hypothetical protein